MKVIRIYDLRRNDCTMDCQCEKCKYIDVDNGAYNDWNYIKNVVPNRFCPKCGWSALNGYKKMIQTSNNNDQK